MPLNPVKDNETEQMIQQSLMNTVELPSIRTQVIIAQISQSELAFPSEYIDEVMIFNRTRVYSLPFYNNEVMGLIHHQGSLVPLLRVPASLLAQTGSGSMKESFSALRLNHRAGAFAGVGIVVDHIKGTMDADKLEDSSIQLFKLEALNPEGCYPQRWYERNSER